MKFENMDTYFREYGNKTSIRLVYLSAIFLALVLFGLLYLARFENWALALAVAFVYYESNITNKNLTTGSKAVDALYRDTKILADENDKIKKFIFHKIQHPVFN